MVVDLFGLSVGEHDEAVVGVGHLVRHVGQARAIWCAERVWRVRRAATALIVQGTKRQKRLRYKAREGSQ